MPPRIRAWVWWFGLGALSLVAAWMSLIAYQQGLPFDELPHLDKAVHFGIGGGLAFFLDGALQRRALRIGSIAAPLAALLILVPAGIEEFLQRFSVHRSSDLGDFAADVAGVVFFVWLSRRLDRPSELTR
jgi:VanZ family protein